MYRLLILLLTLTLLPLSGMAEAPFTFADDLTGAYIWPEGSSEADASYVYRYTYPQVAGDSSLALTINSIFQYEVSYAMDFDCPMTASEHPADQGQMQVTLDYEVTHLSADNLSVRINKTVVLGDYVSRIVKAYTFTLTGPEAGTVTSLPYLLGVIEQDESDEWLINRQITKVDSCVREMVWSMVEADMKKEGSPIYSDMTPEEFEMVFYPEEDFFLDAEGTFVFFVQERDIAPAEAGQFFYTITLDELLDEL